MAPIQQYSPHRKIVRYVMANPTLAGDMLSSDCATDDMIDAMVQALESNTASTELVSAILRNIHAAPLRLVTAMICSGRGVTPTDSATVGDLDPTGTEMVRTILKLSVMVETLAKENQQLKATLSETLGETLSLAEIAEVFDQ